MTARFKAGELVTNTLPVVAYVHHTLQIGVRNAFDCHSLFVVIDEYIGPSDNVPIVRVLTSRGLRWIYAHNLALYEDECDV